MKLLILIHTAMNAAGLDDGQVDAHLSNAHKLDPRIRGFPLRDEKGAAQATMLIGDKGSGELLTSIDANAPLEGASRYLVGADAGSFSTGSKSDEPDVWMNLVIVDGDEGIPFDDPAVLQIMRDQHLSYLPLLGTRHVSCGAMARDDSRCTAAFTVISADSWGEASWLGSLDPWLRVGAGQSLTVPGDRFPVRPAPAGPGVQRQGSIAPRR